MATKSTVFLEPTAVTLMAGTKESVVSLRIPEPEGLEEDGWSLTWGTSLLGLSGPTCELAVVRASLTVPRSFESLLERRGGATVLFGGGWLTGRFIELT